MKCVSIGSAGLAAAALIALLTVGLVTTASAGTGGPAASAAKCKKSPKKKCKKKKKKKPVAPVPAPPAPTATLSVSPAAFNFPDASNGGECFDVPDMDCPDQVFTVTNTGTAASGVPSASVAEVTHPDPGSRPGFKILVNSCAAALAPSATCSLTVTFTPDDEGAYSSTLNVTGAPGGTAQASLTGAGV